MGEGSIRKPEKALSTQAVKAAKEPGKYYDGQGLFLLVKKTGARFWVQRLTIRGKRREIGLGSARLVTLAEARETALDNRRKVRAGIDPLVEKRKAKAALTFAEAAERAHAELSPTWKNPKDRAAFIATLRTYAFPAFGTLAVGDVTSADVRRTILNVRKKTPEVARKLGIRIAAVFKWAIAEGMCDDNPALAQSLALPRLDKKPERRKALPFDDVAGFLTKLQASNAGVLTKLALEFVILTAGRSGEVRGAKWEEMDRIGKVWIVPAQRMKMGRMHRVPLSARAVEILSEAEAFRDASGLVFPGTRAGRPLSDMTLLKLVRELGFAIDVHGFRTSFRTWAQECTNTPREVAEAALAHITGDAVEQAYARSDVFKKRQKLMENWSGFLMDVKEPTISKFIRGGA